MKFDKRIVAGKRGYSISGSRRGILLCQVDSDTEIAGFEYLNTYSWHISVLGYTFIYWSRSVYRGPLKEWRYGF